VKIIIDENLPRSWREYLLPHGIDAIHWRDIGNAGDADEVIFDYACEHEMVICTQDLDFTRILALRGVNLPSIVQLRVDCPLPEVVAQCY
jgi:predicted nuclease of predicted toxin-antitoxin system